MLRQPPDHRGLGIIQAALVRDIECQPDASPFESALYELVKNEAVVMVDVEEAYALYVTDDYRHALYALILAGASDDAISQALEIPPLVLPAFRFLFCDRTVFRHAMEISAYASKLECSDTHKKYYRTALEQGPDFLLNRLRIGKRPALDPKEALRSIAADFYDRFLTHRGQQIDSNNAKEALKWGKEAASVATVLIDKDSNKAEHALEDLKLALLTTDLTSSPKEAGINPDEVITGT